MLHFDDVVIEVCRVPHAVDARNGGYHHYVFSARKQGRGGGKAQLVYLVVDGKVFFYISVRRGQIGFGLVIVVVGHIVFHSIVREESFELAVQLGGQRLVVAQYQRWFVDVGNDVGYGECLSGPGDTK